MNTNEHNNTRERPSHVPDDRTIAPELAFDGEWDADAVAGLIRSKCGHEETPAFLFVGKKEAGLLREHLGEVFGADSVTTLRDTYYMGLEVIELDCESFLSTAGRKTHRLLQDPISRRPAWRDQDGDSGWRFHT
ncbi:hypothetical protein KBB96_17505 [Luteolibacter ambystomatis]|uniref:Uncharacterized protein n=1 Tax=Luteolibacter ambystomatis TaxID=2824561 RepID=A0A975G801_9BACT|nr:hypothetical protein [Luteolibacter ambystomatis]QUE50643.1 hypothetical protein KBB96_17505 [Luteolibacter ambystomatis]